MPRDTYSPADTALLFVDPYNDFLSEGGKLWPLVKDTAVAGGLIDNLRVITEAVRAAGIRVFVVPHRRWQPGDFDGYDPATPYQLGAAAARVFEAGSWGGQWHPEFAPRPGDVVAKEHWGGSGFQSTDLDVLLKQHRVVKVILTLVRDATAAASADRLHAAHELNGPTYAHAILTTTELLATLAAAVPAGPEGVVA